MSTGRRSRPRRDSITGALSLSDKQFGWVLSAFALGYALMQTPSGTLADRFGPRVILTAVVSFWSLFTALTGAAWNLVSLIVCRFPVRRRGGGRLSRNGAGKLFVDPGARARPS